MGMERCSEALGLLSQKRTKDSTGFSGARQITGDLLRSAGNEIAPEQIEALLLNNE